MCGTVPIGRYLFQKGFTLACQFVSIHDFCFKVVLLNPMALKHWFLEQLEDMSNSGRKRPSLFVILGDDFDTGSPGMF